MILSPGERLGPYEILAAAGSGGMGEVYRARDTRLTRIVAIKVIARDVASDPSFKMRFEREARLISALQHPRICVLHDIGHQDGLDFLVLEYIDGETLAARLVRAPLRLPQVLRHAIEIADALEAAHRLGIVHRDLKPQNVMMTEAGAKLVDFGLARAAPHPVVGLSTMSTKVDASTAKGTFVGTLQYMAPEQINGAEPDARTDIFAFGLVLYEMVTGRKAFEATTPASLVAKILETEPPRLSSQVSVVPSALDHLVRMCLAKNPADRWQTMHDVRAQLEWITHEETRPDTDAGAASGTGNTGRRGREWMWAGLAAVALIAAVTAWVVNLRPAPPPQPLARVDVTLPAHLSFPSYSSPMVSPDGRLVVLPISSDGKTQLYLRRLDDTAFLPLAGTEGARGPFWSPDSRSIGFFAGGKLKRIDINYANIANGGPIAVLADGSAGLGATWNRQGVIVFAPGTSSGLQRVSENGGEATPVTVLNTERNERMHRFPSFLPDGRTFLFNVDGPEGGIFAGSLDARPITRVLTDATQGVYVDPGYLLFIRQQTLMAAAFDVATLEVSGTRQAVSHGLRGGQFSIATNGTVAYRSGGDSVVQLWWFTRAGRRDRAVGAPGPYRQIALSPSGRRVVIQQGVPGFTVGADGDLWLMDLITGVHSRLTSDPTHDADPAWSPDERSVVFTSSRTGRSQLFIKDLATGVEKPLADIPGRVAVDEMTPDGRFVIFRTFGRSVHALPMTGDRTPMLLVDTPAYLEDQTHVSPDGKWIAYNADESSRWEVYIAKFPDFSGKRQISNGGGMQAMWRRDGRELYYFTPRGTMMAVTINATDNTEPAVPRALFQANFNASHEVAEYGVTANGERFLVAEPTSRSEHAMTFVFNWTPR